MGVIRACTSPPKERYAATDTNVCKLVPPGTFSDPLTEILRNGARTLLAQAVEAEVADFLAHHADKLTEDGRQRVVRHRQLPENTRPCESRAAPRRAELYKRNIVGGDASALSNQRTKKNKPQCQRRGSSLAVFHPLWVGGWAVGN
jgi:hypothetical protein